MVTVYSEDVTEKTLGNSWNNACFYFSLNVTAVWRFWQEKRIIYFR